MLKIENVEIMGWEPAIRGMRNPMNSWEKSDSGWSSEWPYEIDPTVKGHIFVDSDADGYMELAIGPNDQKLMTNLRNAGTDHRKFMRMITVYMDITAPLYWWKEFDTYKVGTVANSCSTMHKIAAKEFTLDDFSHEHLYSEDYQKDWIDNAEVEIIPHPVVNQACKVWATPLDILKMTIEMLNIYRLDYLDSKSKEDWWQMIQLLPSSYNQRRTVMLNYEVLANMYKSRKDHKLDEWHTFCDEIRALPYSELITGKEILKDE